MWETSSRSEVEISACSPPLCIIHAICHAPCDRDRDFQVDCAYKKDDQPATISTISSLTSSSSWLLSGLRSGRLPLATLWSPRRHRSPWLLAPAMSIAGWHQRPLSPDRGSWIILDRLGRILRVLSQGLSSPVQAPRIPIVREAPQVKMVKSNKS